MILPGKHLRPERSLIGIGGDILALLEQDQTVSELWRRLQAQRASAKTAISFDWFVLSLSLLFATGAVGFERGLLSKRHHDDS